MQRSTLEIGVAQLCSVTEIGCVNRGPNWFGFRASERGIRYCVKIAFTDGVARLRRLCDKMPLYITSVTV